MVVLELLVVHKKDLMKARLKVMEKMKSLVKTMEMVMVFWMKTAKALVME